MKACVEDNVLMDGAIAVPFVTWGQACSGVALWQMGSALKEKGFKTELFRLL